jgi:hypothetical protein
MELVTTQQEVYEFHELSEKAKDSVRIALIQDYECEHIIDSAKEEGRAKGFIIDDVRYSVGTHTHDGASWTGAIDLIDFFEAHPDPEFIGEEVIIIELMRNDWIDKSAEVNQHSFHYVDSSTMKLSDVVDYAESAEEDSNNPLLSVGILENANVKELFDSFHWAKRLDLMVERALEAVKEYADNIYTQIKEDYEWQVSDENINELIYINGWRFNKRGEII